MIESRYARSGRACTTHDPALTMEGSIMSGYLRLLACIAVLALAGCGKQGEPPPEPQGGSRIPDDNVFKDQVRALEKAEDVGKTLDAAAARQREQVERDSR
jgi:hypothetical protein